MLENRFNISHHLSGEQWPFSLLREIGISCHEDQRTPVARDLSIGRSPDVVTDDKVFRW